MVSSFVVLGGFLDFGIGNATLNQLAAAHAKADSVAETTLISASRRLLTRIGLSIATLAAIACAFVPWHAALGLPASASAESRIVVTVVLLLMALAVPLSLTARVQLARGQGHTAFAWQAVGQIGALAVTMLVSTVSHRLVVFTTVSAALPVIAALANTVISILDEVGLVYDC
ncbi:MAG: hypothetical protein ACJ8HC_11835, partial [Paraburkholderia graminis]|uniref:hypothetical protein n=1 Tax=Paraburkholderia graminis TaxID=60548 RepID=UPI00389ABB03